MKKTILKKYPGFSFIESILSIFLISTGLLAGVILVGNGVGKSIDSRNQLIAGELAQEEVELVRNIRDNNWASSDAGGSFAHTAGPACGLDRAYAYPAAWSCSIASEEAVYVAASGFYDKNSSGSSSNKFRRKVVITTTATDMTVTAMVIWNVTSYPTVANCNLANHCVYTQEVMTKWGGN